MLEMSGAGEDHRDAELVGGVDRELVVHRAAGLDDRLDAVLRGHLDAVGEGEEGVACHDGRAGFGDGAVEAGEASVGDSLGAREGLLGRPDAVHLSAGESDGDSVLDDDDRVRFDEQGHCHAEGHLGGFVRGRGLFGHDLNICYLCA